MAWSSSAKGRCWCREPRATQHIPHTLGAEARQLPASHTGHDTLPGCAGLELGMLLGFWDARGGMQTGMAWETKQHVRIDVAEQGTSREKQIQAGTAHAVA